jgi:class 3 adenylate cyclase
LREAVVTAHARKPGARDRPPIRRTRSREDEVPPDAADEAHGVLLALVDELAVLAADLWFAGRLECPSVEEEVPDDDDNQRR